ncbi:hypothetical protein Cni_G29059 [Canna indica]|uniref:Uncharacterized protein n=1 Tax=Canna indica TaxID=4628 RepID=A0AAQ3L532_9LILI|nr:hypothetical protein Cni_G29059 [Canna indica]
MDGYHLLPPIRASFLTLLLVFIVCLLVLRPAMSEAANFIGEDGGHDEKIKGETNCHIEDTGLRKRRTLGEGRRESRQTAPYNVKRQQTSRSMEHSWSDRNEIWTDSDMSSFAKSGDQDTILGLIELKFGEHVRVPLPLNESGGDLFWTARFLDTREGRRRRWRA